MAITVAKVTYSLKPETVDRVQELSTAWGVPKSEVIQRAVAQVSQNEASFRIQAKLAALDRLQKSATLTAAEAAKWNREIRLSRHAWGRKRGLELEREWQRVQTTVPASPPRARQKRALAKTNASSS